MKEKGLKYNNGIPSLDIIVNVEIENYDDLVKQMQEADEIGISISDYDVQEMYKKLCYDVLVKQENEYAKFAPERSWTTLKEGLNVWVMERLTRVRTEAYNVIVNDLMSENSQLKIAIEKTLISFRPITSEFLGEQSERKKKEKTLPIPPMEDFFTKDYEEIKFQKSAITPFYQYKNASQIEKDFINFLESQENVKWWYKNGDKGESYFSVPYNENKSLFYPDWFVKLKNGNTLILDTKGGETAKEGAKLRIEALHKFLKEENLYNFIAGVVIKHSDIWKINKNEIYEYGDNFSNFIPLSEVI